MSNMKRALDDYKVTQLQIELNDKSLQLFAAGQDDVMSADDYVELEREVARLTAELFEAKIDAGYTSPWYNTGMAIGDFI